MHVDANVSPRVHFVEPVADAVEVDPPADVHVQEEPELDADPPMAVGEEEPYRPSPQSPSPAPESEDELEIVPVVTKDVEPGTAPVDDAEAMRETVPSPVAVEPPSPNWDPTASLSPDIRVPAPLVRDPSPAPAAAAPAPAPPAKVSFKEWQARRKLERAKVEEQEERDREMQRGQEMEREKEQREREKDGADKENDAVPSKAEDGLTRILDGIRRSAVGDKPPSVEVVQQDVEMPDAVPVEIAPAPLDGLQPKEKARLLSMTAFVAGENAHLLSPLAVPSTVESRTPSPRLTNGIKREVSPLATTVSAPSPPPPTAPAPPPPPSVLHSPQAVRLPSPSFMSAPPPPLFASPSPQRRRSPPPPSPPRKFLSSPPPPPPLESPRVRRSPSPLSPPRSVLPSPPPPSVLQSPKAPHYPSSFFTSNGVPRPTAFLSKPLPSSNFTTSRLPQPRSRGPPSPLPQPRPSPVQFRARAPSQEEGEILPNSSPPPTPMRVPRFGSQPTPARMSPFAASSSPFATPNGPPTQPRSHQLGRMPPSAPKALREAQNPNAMALGGGSGGPARGAQRFNGMGPQTIPSTVLEPQPRGRRGGRWGKQRQRGT
ncbi:hypothetical protein DFH08DRAFT_903041 [Mycena albidolilacea]|uniref:Uncharacterized protein n=1 Tax=Mycena albidolilacea TaxID=1033008 RepID=A0AAD7E9E6_9AGAR|nr:hypothetical protein DFH08DRAFT_903041 [Mycena albidolilacea]